MRVFCFFLLIFLSIISCYGQGTATGCLIPFNNRVYTSNALEILGTSQLYNNSPYTPLSTDYCSWTPSSTAASCVVCDGTLGLDLVGIKICLFGTFRYGSEGTFTMVQCDLDDHSWLFGAAAGLFGLLVIRKRKNK